jgi:hypothetical protein
MEQRRIRPTLNRKEFMRVAPHQQEACSHWELSVSALTDQNGK